MSGRSERCRCWCVPTSKRLPAPERMRAYFAALPDGSLERTITQLRDLRVVPAAAFWFDGFSAADDRPAGDDGRVAIFLEGSTALVDRAGLELRSALGRGGVPGDARARRRRAGGAGRHRRRLCVGARTTFDLVSHRFAAERCVRSRRSGRRMRAPFRLRRERIVDLMNGDTIVRVSELDVQRFAACMNDFDAALHGRFPKRSSSRASIRTARRCNCGDASRPRSNACARSNAASIRTTFSIPDAS